MAELLDHDKVPRRTRRCLESIARHRQAILMVVEDDTPGKLNPGPAGFDRGTIDWAIETADLIVVWSAGWDAPGAPEQIDDYLEAGRSVLMILTGSRSEAAWIALTAPHFSKERAGSLFCRGRPARRFTDERALA